MVTVLFTFWPNTYWVDAQPLTNTQQDQQQPITAASPPPRLHAVKITSPTTGQQVPSDGNNNLTISGISIANATTSHCQVSVIVNDLSLHLEMIFSL
jgi:hypothetical protein